jgi:hypothetical protein
MALGTPFTYQGVLRSSGSPVSGTCDFLFGLWDAASSGTQIGATWPQAGVPVTRGLFTVLLDFGAAPFQGANRYLEIAVRCPAGSGAYTTLTPRQPLTPGPYALYANAAHWAGLLGIPAGFADNVDNDTTYIAGAGLTLVGTQFSVVFAGTGAASTVARSDHDHDARYWKLNGNSGTTPGVNYLGTSDNTILELKVNNVRALRLEPSAISPNIVGGYPGNNMIAGGVGGTVGGGGASGGNNRVTDSYGTVSGGANNQAGNGNVDLADATYATVGGGQTNTASGARSTVSGGSSNTASGANAMIPGGISNTAAGAASLAAGTRALANHAGAFVWADSTDMNFASTGANQFAVRAGGGVWFTSTLGDMFRMLPNSTAPNIIGGYQGNTITTGVAGATIAGGGISTGFNRVTDQHGTIGGGAGNVAGNDAGATTDAGYATISGGWLNTASGSYSSIGGGWSNTAAGIRSTVGGGQDNTAGSGYTTVGGGDSNQASGERTTVAGGASNIASGHTATVGGGAGNTASGSRATVSGGQGNSATNVYTAVGGGYQNLNQGQYATISGGYTNTIGISANYSTIGGGTGNVISNTYAVIAGGYHNSVGHDYATVGGGHSNVATGQYAAIGGGIQNTASAPWSTIPGGSNNTAAGSRSFAAGNRAKANHTGAFVWADSTDADIASTVANQFIVRASGGVYFYTNAGLTTGMYLAPGSSNWQPVPAPSDRSLKENIEPVDGKDTLKLLAQVPIAKWNYIADEPVPHIGPMAQDFYAAFGVGEDDTHISTIDASGVALAAIQGLYEIVQEKDAQIAAQQTQIDDLQARLLALESLVAKLAKGGSK